MTTRLPEKSSQVGLENIVDSKLKGTALLIQGGIAHHTVSVHIRNEFRVSMTIYPCLEMALRLRDRNIPFKFYLDFTKTARYKKMGIVYLEDLGHSFNTVMRNVDSCDPDPDNRKFLDTLKG